jgi:hypothetical protein
MFNFLKTTSMERSNRIWLGIFTFLPLVLLIGYLVQFALLVREVIVYGNDIATLGDVSLALLLMLGIGVVSFGLFVFYILHVIYSKADKNEKLLWIILFFVGNIFAFPVYFYMKVWKAPHEHGTMLAN